MEWRNNKGRRRITSERRVVSPRVTLRHNSHDLPGLLEWPRSAQKRFCPTVARPSKALTTLL
eukprot:7323593-Prymnesium_polylepis.1